MINGYDFSKIEKSEYENIGSQFAMVSPMFLADSYLI